MDKFVLAKNLDIAVPGFRSTHYSQWLPLPGGGRSGGNGCAEASIARAVSLYDPTTPARMANPEWDLVRRVADPKDPATKADLMDRVSMIARGQHLAAGDNETTAAGIEAALGAFGLPWSAHYAGNEAGAYQIALKTPLSIVWVDGSALSGAYASGGYFGAAGGQGNHIMTWLPNLDGQTPNLFNDPLADVPDMQSDHRYPLDMFQSAFYGCWTLPVPEPTIPRRTRTIAPCALKEHANHLPSPMNRVVCHLPAGQVVTIIKQHPNGWTGVATLANGAHVSGNVLTNNLHTA